MIKYVNETVDPELNFTDLLGPDGLLSHKELLERLEADNSYLNITFQNGPVGEVGVNGVQVDDVIDVLVDHLQQLNVGEMRCRETSLAITALEEAKLWLLQRRMNRLAQGVEGTMEPHSS